MRLAHELPKRRKIAIQEALAAHQTENRPDWDRTADWANIKMFRKTIKTGTIRTVLMPLLEVDLGDPWPIPITVIHGVRPGPTITVGGIHGDELTGASAYAFTIQFIY